jgi:anthrone oxygenase-like protein
VIGALEIAAFLSTLGMALVTRSQPRVAVLGTGASICLLLMIWAVWINPINNAVNSWTPESLPQNWADFRERWHLLHAVRLLLSAAAFSATIAAFIA